MGIISSLIISIAFATIVPSGALAQTSIPNSAIDGFNSVVANTVAINKSKSKKKGVFFSREQVSNIFKNAFGQDCMVLLGDKGYYAIPNDQFMKLVSKRKPDPWYSVDLYDCSRFSVGFYTDLSRIWADKTWGRWPLAFAVVKVKRPNSPNHVLIVQIDDRGIIHFIEPQEDSIVPQDNMQPYFIEA